MASDLTLNIPFEPTLNTNKLNAILRELKAALGPLGKEIKEFDADKLEKSLTDTVAEAKKLENETEKISENLKKAADQDLGGGLRKVLADVSKFAGGQLLAGAVTSGFSAVANGIATVGKKMLQGAAEMETYKTQLTALLHSSTLAEERLKELAKFGAETPFELPDLINAERVLIGFGLQGEKAMRLTGKSATELRTILGDVAAGINIPFEELAVTIGKFSTGATGEAIARLQELGIVTKEELQNVGIQFDRAGSLASSVPEALTAATAIMEKKFGGGMLALSKTAEGQISTLKDNLAQMFRDLGTPLFEALKPAIGQINELLGSDEIKNTITQLGSTLGGIATTILPPVMQLVSSLVPLVSTLLAAIIPILNSLFAAIIPVVQILAEQLAPVFTQIFTNLQPLIKTIVEVAGTVLAKLLNALAPIWDLLPPLAQLLSDLLVPLLNALMPVLNPLIDILSAFIKIISPILGIIIELVNLGLKPFTFAMEILGKVIGVVEGVVASLWQSIAGGINTVIDFIKKGLEPLNNIFEETKKFIEGVVSTISDFVNGVGEMLGLVEKKDFKAPINPNYSDEMNKAATANRNFANSITDVKEPKTSNIVKTIPISPKSKSEVKDITDDIVKIEREIARIKREEQTKQIEDERLREKTFLENKLNDSIAAIEDEIKKIKGRKDVSAAQKIEYEKALNKKIELLQENHKKNLNDIDKKYDEKAKKEQEDKERIEKEKIRKKREEEIKALEEANQEKLKLYENEIKERQRLQELLFNIGDKIATKKADTKFESEKAELDKLKESKLIPEIEYQSKREKLEKDHQARLAQIQATANGLRLEAERQQTLALLEEKKKLLQTEIEKDPENQEKIKELNALNNAIAEKGNLILANAQLLQENIAEIFGNLFSGDDAMKDSARNSFATLAGILKKLAASTIAQIVLNQLGIASIGTGLASLLLAPVITAIVTAGVNAILDPIIASITSFATGGRVDKPSLIIAGDASKARTGADTEWIFRDDQIKTLIDDVVWKYLQLDVSVQEFHKMSIQDALLSLGSEINYLTNLFKSKDVLSVNNLKTLFNEMDNINQAESLFYSNRITDDELINLISASHSKIQGFTNKNIFSNPELITNSEIAAYHPNLILTLPTLQNIITETSHLTNRIIETKLDELINKLDDFEGRIHILENDIGRAANNYNYRQKRRNVIK